MKTTETILSQADSTHASKSNSLLPAQQSLENESSNEISGYLPIQRKLTVGAPDDPLEYEADAIADKVMRMPEPGFIQRKCAHCEEEERAQRKPLASFIQRKESMGVAAVSDTVSNSINASKGNGNRLDIDTRGFMENRFGADFGSVHIHTGNDAIQMNRDLHARAFTVGNDIYFNEGQYHPGSDSGKHLLAHELTHTLQQTGTVQRDPQRLPTGTYPDLNIDKDSAELIITRAQEGKGDFGVSVGVDEPVSLIPPILKVPSDLPPATFTLKVSYDDRCNRTIQGASLSFRQSLTDRQGFTDDPLRTIGAKLGLRFGSVRADGSVEASFNGDGFQAALITANFTVGVSQAIPDECKHKKPPGGGDHGGGDGDFNLKDLCAGIDCDQSRTRKNLDKYLICCLGRPPKKPVPPSLPPLTVYYYYDTPIRKPESNSTAVHVFDTMQMLPSVHVQITGHTSLEGTEIYNKKLSQRRADALKDYLLLKGIDSTRIHVKAMGEIAPAVAEPPEPKPRRLRFPEHEAIRDLNRRAEVIFYDPSGKLSFLPTFAPVTLTVPDLSLRTPGSLRGTGRFLQAPHLTWGTDEQ